MASVNLLQFHYTLTVNFLAYVTYFKICNYSNFKFT